MERPAAEVGEREPGDTDVVRDQVALRQAALREEDLVWVRDVDARSIVEECWKATPSRT
jgi:hypothetical protein